MAVFALLSIFSGALLVYLASKHQRLRPQSLPAAVRHVGWLLLAAGTGCWLHEAGLGAGLAAALATLMLSWVTLPYLAWWRGACAEHPAS